MALSESSVCQSVQVIDALCFASASIIIFEVYTNYPSGIPWEYCALIFAAVGIMVSLNGRAGLYDFETIATWPHRMFSVIWVMSLTLLILVAMGFALKVSDQFSRFWLFATFGSTTVLIIAARGILLVLVRRWAQSGRLRRRLAVFGSGPQAAQFLDGLSVRPTEWQEIVGVFDDRTGRAPAAVAGYPVKGGMEDLINSARNGDLDSVVIALPWHADRRLSMLVERLRELPVHVFLGADLITYNLPAHQREELSGLPVLKVVSPPLSGWQSILKSAEDRVLGTLLVVGLSPILALIALAVRLESPGPAFFIQNRYGYNNQLIRVRKFRSMYHNRPPETGVPQATRNDPRVTRVGRILRKTSLDELPQLFNVVEGSMSLVGPRPHAVEHNEKYMELISGYSARHNVKPGITGWAQVNGLRGETETVDKMEARVRFDVYYTEHWSLWFDLRILIMTAGVAWRQSTAY